MTTSREKRAFHTPQAKKDDELLPLRLDGKTDVIVTVCTREGIKTPRVKGLAHKNLLWESLCRAYQKIAYGKATNKYLDALRWLAKYLVALDGEYSSLQEIDSRFFNDYAAFLRQSKLGIKTRYNYYADVGVLVKAADKITGRHTERIIPSANHGEKDIHRKKTSKLSSENILAIAKAALTECTQTMRNYANARFILTLKKIITPRDKKAYFYRTLSEKLYFCDNKFEVLFKHSGTNFRAEKFRPLFFPTARTTIPFIILITIYTAYNPDTAKQLKFSDITVIDNESNHGDDSKTIVIQAVKNRAKTLQTVSFPITDDPSNPYVLLEFQKIWRSAVSALTSNENRDFCFLYVPIGRKEIKPFFDEGTSAVATRNFVKDHNLPDFQLDDIRQAMLDMGGHLFGGNLLALQKIAGHLNIVTTHQNYSSTTLTALNDEKFAVYLDMRERWIESMGKVDPRDLSGNPEILSATPGFLCLDPHDSPIQGERSGKLCKAYGACPNCPLSAVRTDSPHSYLRLLQLKRLIGEAKSELSPSRWLSVWRGRLVALDRWLACFPAIVVERAASLVEPGPLPPLE